MHKPFSRNSEGFPDLAESLGHHWEDHSLLGQDSEHLGNLCYLVDSDGTRRALIHGSVKDQLQQEALEETENSLALGWRLSLAFSFYEIPLYPNNKFSFWFS